MVVYDIKKMTIWSRGTQENIKKIHNERTRNTIKCKCGHSIAFKSCEKKKLCHWCNKWVFKNKEDEFKYRLKEKMK